jgi:hypothetical protein
MLVNKIIYQPGNWLPIKDFSADLIYAASTDSLSGAILCLLINLCEEKFDSRPVPKLATEYSYLTCVLQPCNCL